MQMIITLGIVAIAFIVAVKKVHAILTNKKNCEGGCCGCNYNKNCCNKS